MQILLVILTVLSSFLENLETTTLQTDFIATTAEEVNAPMNYPGTLTLQGRRFKLTMYNMEAAYDGQTLYMYSSQTDELTLSNPTEQELVEANPFLFAKTMADMCQVTEQPSADGAETVIVLTTKEGQAMKRFTLCVRNADLMPLRMEMKEGKKYYTLTLKNPQFVTEPQQYTLTPDEGTYVNDMRL